MTTSRPGGRGLPGAQGIQGVPGIQGPPGIAGAQGVPGLPGADGVDGVDGADGAQGIQGIPGPQGIPGTPGAPGAQGIQGIPGTAGATGATGPAGPGLKSFRATGVSNAAGQVVFNLTPAAFAAAPVAALAIQSPSSSNPIDYRIVALTAASCTVEVRQSPALIVLSLSVLGISAPLAGVTVHGIFMPAGSQV